MMMRDQSKLATTEDSSTASSNTPRPEPTFCGPINLDGLMGDCVSEKPAKWPTKPQTRSVIPSAARLPSITLEGDHGGAGSLQFRRVYTAGDIGNVDFVDHVSMPPGSGIGLHPHPTSNELYIAIRGSAVVNVADETAELLPSGIAVVKAGGSHRLTATGTDEYEMVVVQVPAPTAVTPIPGGFKIRATRGFSYSLINTSQPIFSHDNDLLGVTIAGRPVVAVVDRVLGGPASEFASYCNRHGIAVLASIEISGQEGSKRQRQVDLVLEQLASAKLPRDGVVIGIGGGVVLDIAGFAASVYYRGVPYVRIPTTLIAIADVACGIKQGFNLGARKNGCGSFYPAEANLCDRRLLVTLKRRHITAGMAEILKMAMIGDEQLFRTIEDHAEDLVRTRFQKPAQVAEYVISRAQELMVRELAPNLWESNLQRRVDFGHTVSQGIEAASKYAVPHGHAVAADMAFSMRISVLRGFSSTGDLTRLEALYRRLKLPLTTSPCAVPQLSQALDAARRHRAGALNFVVPVGIGDVTFLQELAESEILAAVMLRSGEDYNDCR